MNYIKVWCEYDIGGDFGGNNNETIFKVPDNLDTKQIEELLTNNFKYYNEILDEPEGFNMLDEGLMGWEYIDVELLE
jgi:hypothetical protein